MKKNMQTKIYLELDEEEVHVLKEAAAILGEIIVQSTNCEIYKGIVKQCDGEHIANAEIVLRCLAS